jgi:hypothetical protein
MRAVALLFALAQLLLPKPSTPQHISVVTSASTTAVTGGATATLWADVTPKPKIHVYATAKDGFTPVSLTFSPSSHASIGKVTFPPAEVGLSPGTAPVPVYTKPFRLSAPVTIGARAPAGETLTLAAVLTYPACDDALCYPAETLPVSWTMIVK